MMELSSLERTAIKIIKDIKYLNLATITPDGLPWNSAVFTAFDEDLNFYFLSWKENQHSINIRNNPKAFVTIYDSTVPPSSGVGVYLEGEVEEMSNPIHIIEGLKVIYKRSNKSMREVKQFLTHFPRRAYRFKPNKAWVNGDSDVDGNFIDIRTEVSLMALRSGIRD